MDLIERKELLERIEMVYCSPCREKEDDYNGIMCRACGTGCVKDMIEDAPTADAEPVVRCKDCAFVTQCRRTVGGLYPYKLLQYCSMGVKKDVNQGNGKSLD